MTLQRQLALSVGMVVILRTGGVGDFSTAWFSRVATTVLAQDHASPQVAHKLAQFLTEGHGLVEIGQEIAKGRSRT